MKEKSNLLELSRDEYWMNVFEKAGAPDLYNEGRPEITRALTAGLEPYYRGETVTAAIFADLALNAIEEKPIAPLAAAQEEIIFKP